ncbi:MAG TPA: hypothetical protein VKB69_13420 [Micromonosporaceae bacterium]|nr:hypothetical protein [Micromonosporaceae bacterium]
MARKFLIFATAATVAAVVVSTVARRRANSPAATAKSRPVPVTTTAAENASRFSAEWRADDAYSQEFASAAKEEAAAAH